MRSRSRFAVLAATALASCAAAGAIASTSLIGLDILRKTFSSTAAQNYGEEYKENADDLFKVIAKPVSEKAQGAKSSSGSTPIAPDSAPSGSVATAPPPPNTPVDSPVTPAVPLASASEPTAATPAKEVPLALEVGLFKEMVVEGKSMPVPVQDGETLYDPYGSHGGGDAIKFMFRANVDAYVYVISIDGTGWIQPIFPGAYSESKNPVKAGETCLFPEGSTWAPLDSYRGVEHLYFLASRSARPDLEQALLAFATRNRGVDPARGRGASPEPLAQVSGDAPLTRGFDAPRKSVHQIQASAGQKVEVDSQLFVSNRTGDILVTRWFRHE